MEREDDVIELGAASVETRGPRGDEPDIGLGQVLTGLTDD
jgi:hypothetical protein